MPKAFLGVELRADAAPGTIRFFPYASDVFGLTTRGGRTEVGPASARVPAPAPCEPAALRTAVCGRPDAFDPALESTLEPPREPALEPALDPVPPRSLS